MLMQVNDSEANKSWYELGQWEGLDIVNDDEVEEELEKEEKDKEVERIYHHTKLLHKQLLRGKHVEGIKRKNNTCIHSVLVKCQRSQR